MSYKKYFVRISEAKKFDITYYTYMWSLNIQVPVPKRVPRYQQLILAFRLEVWILFGK